jgi:hypothetical protein
MAAAASLAARWLANPWLAWGAGPMLAVDAGFFLMAAVLELLLATHWFDARMLAYPSAETGGKPKRREAALAATRARIPFAKQVWTCVRVVAGPMSVANGVTLALLFRLAGVPAPTAWWPESVAAAVWQLVAMAVIADFGLVRGGGGDGLGGTGFLKPGAAGACNRLGRRR